MNILVTGAAGFVGKNLVSSLKNIRDHKDSTHSGIIIDEIFEYDTNTGLSLLDNFCERADFVFNLAGVNRAQEQLAFVTGNVDFTSTLLKTLKKHKNDCPVMLSSSIQATGLGRYTGSEYGKSKLAGEELFFNYGNEIGAKVLVYRFPNIFGKWCKPNYNSVVATFCYNIANDLSIQINDPSMELEFLYIDDLVDEMLYALEGKEHRCNFDDLNVVADDNGRYCYVPTTYKVTLGKIAELLIGFKEQTNTLQIPEIPSCSFVKKLYSTYLSYLPKESIAISLKMNVDNRGSFTEILKPKNCGQFSINISKPGITKGNHWHHTKCEIFIVVSGRGLIRQRKIGVDKKGNLYPVINTEVSGNKIEAVHILPGYTHDIINSQAHEKSEYMSLSL